MYAHRHHAFDLSGEIDTEYFARAANGEGGVILLKREKRSKAAGMFGHLSF